MEIFKEVMNYVSLAITIILTIVYLILNHSKSKKTKSANGIIDLLTMIPTLIETAESMFEGKGKGASKLNYVLTQVQIFALQNGITFDIEAIKSYINNLVDTTKKVNTFELKPLQPEENQ